MYVCNLKMIFTFVISKGFFNLIFLETFQKLCFFLQKTKKKLLKFQIKTKFTKFLVDYLTFLLLS